MGFPSSNKKAEVYINAVILAGGLGSRLRSVVANSPKVMAPVCGRPFLSYLLDQVISAQITKAILCTGYLADQISDTFGGQYRSLQLAYSREPSPMGTGGALSMALPYIEADYCLVMNGDSYFDIDLAKFIQWHFDHKFSGSLALVSVENANRFGSVEIDADNAIQHFREKSAQPASNWVNAGIYLLSKKFLETIPKDVPQSIERDLFPNWIPFGLGGYCQRASFLDIGTPESYAQAENFFSNAVNQAD